MRHLFLDFETFSATDILSCGSYKYMEDPEFLILLMAYAYDDEPVKQLDFEAPDFIPQSLVDALTDPDIVKHAWNTAFERNAIHTQWGIYSPPEQWVDDMIVASYNGLPRSLEAAGKAIGLAEDKQKLKTGRELIRWFSKPTPAGKRRLPADHPEKWEKYKEYNRQDVETERAIHHMMSRQPPEEEHRLWCIDQRMNERGVRVDLQLAHHAVEFDERYKTDLTEQAIELTGIKNPNSVTQIKNYLKEKEGIEVESLNKTVLPGVLASLKTDEARKFMAMRIEMARSSTAKYKTMERCACADGHVKGVMGFYGARTGRWISQMLQMQNMTKNKDKDIDTARSLVKEGDYETTYLLYDSISSTLSQLVRPTIIPEDGHQFLVADYSAIEARVVAWLSGEQWVLDAFRDGKDIYCETASMMFGVPVEKHGINGELRAKGKVAVLACIAEDELVLTDFGLVPIQDVTTDMKVWDGENWVRHEGVIYQGEKEVIEYDGLRATEDHPVYVEGHWGTVPFGTAKDSGSVLLKSGSGRYGVRVVGDYLTDTDIRRDLAQLSCTGKMPRMRNSEVATNRTHRVRKVKRLSALQSTERSSVVAREKIEQRKAEMRKPKQLRVQKLWGTGNKVQLQIWRRSREVDGEGVRNPGQKLRTRPHRHKWKLRTRKPSLCYARNKPSKSASYSRVSVGSEILALRRNCGKKVFKGRLHTRRDNRLCTGCSTRTSIEVERNPGKVRVYDIRNAGRHHRYTVSGKLVHNCGYGGGIGALKAMGGERDGLTEEEMVDIKDRWRERNSNTVKLWTAIENAAVKAVVRRTTVHSSLGPVAFEYDTSHDILWCHLPSGRAIAYQQPRYTEVQDPYRYGKALSYMGLNQTTKKWERVPTWGGKLVENATQAIARDCLREAMFALEEEHYDMRFSVHDEIIITEPINSGRTSKDVCEIMGRDLKWAPGLPLRAEGFEAPYYMKD